MLSITALLFLCTVLTAEYLLTKMIGQPSLVVLIGVAMFRDSLCGIRTMMEFLLSTTLFHLAGTLFHTLSNTLLGMMCVGQGLTSTIFQTNLLHFFVF